MSQNGPGVTTEQLMQIAMEMAGQTKFPADSRIHVPGKNIKKILFGIDMGVAELLVGKELGYDCVMAHHPDPSVQTFPEVLDLHVDIAVRNGVPEDEVRPVIETMKRNQRLVRHSANYDHAPSFARLLNMPYLNIHNPLDEIGRKRMQDAIDAQCGPDATVDDVMAALNTIPEIKDAPTNVELRLGKGSNKAGKTVVAHGAGTNGGAPLARVYFRNGVDTLVYIHIGAAEIPKLAAEFPEGKNLVISGHIASDVAGINPFIWRLEEMGIEVTRVSGL
ncbi:MAG: hypothetical protein ACOX5Q_03030 [Bacillota bacterium]|jgi:hypothetical protein|nr:hypothetical protein [Candidatus Fermentithermobacillaceae bacterium]